MLASSWLSRRASNPGLSASWLHPWGREEVTGKHCYSLPVRSWSLSREGIPSPARSRPSYLVQLGDSRLRAGGNLGSSWFNLKGKRKASVLRLCRELPPASPSTATATGQVPAEGEAASALSWVNPIYLPPAKSPARNGGQGQTHARAHMQPCRAHHTPGAAFP